jgi:Fe-S-cluster containining protein
MNNLVDEQTFAQNNYQRLAMNLPKRLKEREDTFAIGLKKAKTNPANQLATLYTFMEELYDHVARYTPCKKGCDHCCYYRVTLTDIEIDYIERHTHHKRLKSYLPKQEFHGQACTFLDNGACSIYEARPFVCRRHVVLTNTNTWCQSDISRDETFTILRFSSVDASFEHIRQLSGSLELYDIRQVFGQER